MGLSLTPEQEMLKSAARFFVEQEYPKETLLQIAVSANGVADAPWQKLIGTGWASSSPKSMGAKATL
jgi:hypothetical protein